MFRRSTNNPWISPDGKMNSGSFAQIGGEDVAPVLAAAGGGRFPGLLGQTVVHSNRSALQASKTTVGTLFQGVYQLVKFTGAMVRGQLVFWDTLANNGLAEFEVTHTVTAASCFRAGVSLFTDSGSSGKFGWIQVAGLASMKFGNSAVGTIGLGVIQATALDVPLLSVATVNTTAMATAQLAEDVIALVGQAYEAPTQDSVSRVIMNMAGFYPNIG